VEALLLESLLGFGPMGIFAAFLLWQHQGMQKRLDKIQEDFKTMIEAIQERSEEKEEMLRDRYDKVIGEYREERTMVRSNVTAKITEVLRHIKSLEETTDNNSNQLTGIANKTEKVLEIFQDMQQEAKIKEAARAARLERE
jgi:ribosome-binding protein aMBF1 (putative translation factor)